MASQTTDDRWRVAGYASGAAFAVIALVAFLIALGPDDPSFGVNIVVYFADHDDAVRWQAALFGIAALLLLWFAGTLAAVARAVGGEAARRYAGIVLTATGAAVALYSIGVGCWFTLANTFGGAEVVEGEHPMYGDAAVLWNSADAAFTLSNFPAAALVAAASLAALEARYLPRWAIVAGLAVAAFLLVQGFLQAVGDADVLDVVGILAFLAFLAWAFVTSTLLTVVARPDVAPTVS